MNDANLISFYWVLGTMVFWAFVVGIGIHVTSVEKLNKSKSSKGVIHIVVKNNQGQRYEGDIEEV
jgi:formate-dependent nitrite reductase membrane component NrfD